MTCLNPLIDVTEVLTMSTPRAHDVTHTTEVTNPSSKFVVFDGMKFQSLWFHDPNTTEDCQLMGPTFPNASTMAFILTIWEALVLLPLAQGTTNVPSYLPVLTALSLQEGDLADRVLWKRLTHLFVQGTNSFLVPTFNPDSSARYNTETAVAVKTRCKIDDRHGLFRVINMVHDVFLPFPPAGDCDSLDCDQCTAIDSNNTRKECGKIPIVNDYWAKMFYHVRG